jgi:LPS export ABC transporter permease LptG
MQACGVSLLRLLRPILFVAAIGTAATAYETIVALPNGNQTFREIVFVLLAERVENNVKPRIFYQDFPNKVIYVRDLPPEGGWRDVFLADTDRTNETTVYFAREGRIHRDREKRLVQLELTDGTSHTTHVDKPDDYEETAFDRILITLDPETVFKAPPSKGAPEMTYAELRASIAAADRRHDPAYESRFMVQQKLSLPLACPVLALIGLALGATSRKDGKLASFVLGISVIFVYYVLLWGARAAAMGGRFSPDWAPWIPNIVLGIAGLLMMMWRTRSADRPIRLSLPAFRWPSSDAPPSWSPGGGARGASAVPPRRTVVVIRVPHLDLPMPKLLDMYVSREYLRVLLLGIVSLLGIFYIATFIDLADKMFRGEATGAMVLRYFFFRTPQFVYYVIPMSVLVSTLVTIGVMTKNSELLVMRACGISLYRTAAPLVVFALIASGALFLMQERVLAGANREADRLERIIRRWPPATTGLGRRWVVGTSGDMYHYELFDPEANRFSSLWVYRVDDRAWRLRAVTRVNDATLVRRPSAPGETQLAWEGRQGWTRELTERRKSDVERAVIKYVPFDARDLSLEPPSYFKNDEPIAELMTYGELRDYIQRLRVSGANVIPQIVALQRKIAFPFVTVIMTLLAVPFAVTTGRHGAMYGIGIGIVLAIVYWVMLSVAGALGAGGVLPPTLAAWSPNILFGAAAAYMLLTVRT